MRRTLLLVVTLLIAAVGLTEGTPTKLSIQWLSWPVTGYPFEGPDPDIVIPTGNKLFEADVRKDVIIGLRSDGIVVWKYVDALEESL